MKIKILSIFSIVVLLIMILSFSDTLQLAEGSAEEATVEYIPEVYVDPIHPDDVIDEEFDYDDSLAEVRELIASFDGDGSVNFNLETGEMTIEEKVSSETESLPNSTGKDGVTSEESAYLPNVN
ncbi:hypothetical protein [Alkalibacterium olivapovliticus]|uniref:Uncharacterized protein n=1 Tax=Alkalibacterium olivapovliticus TaxID=99907 RepID=A0A2T0VVB8_9LACT|nr:hypothetical protein [Alkalibacterium olivapovliticus]PRY75647.1 hypothetical protein CLV38_13423 [Alkalibacterium olivapovliticus]